MQHSGDVDIIAQVRNGCADAFASLVTRYDGLVRRIARAQGARDENLDDIAQDVWLTAYLALPQLRDATRFKGWLARITVTTCAHALPAFQHHLVPLETCAEVMDEVSPAGDPLVVVETRERRQEMFNVIATLSSRDAQATWLFYYEHYQLAEIAALLGISVTAVKSRLFKARGQLRHHFTPSSAPSGGPLMAQLMIEGMHKSPLTEHHVVTLFDPQTRRCMHARISAAEAQAIALALYEREQLQFTSLHVLMTTLQAFQMTMATIELRLLNESVLFATLHLRRGKTHRAIDARPGDALGLALVTEATIQIADDLLDRLGMVVPAGETCDVFWAKAVLEPLALTLPEETLLALAYGQRPPAEAAQATAQASRQTALHEVMPLREELEHLRRVLLANAHGES